jgi:protein-S-isoprenylcysteine O-methyltransferase Ste14
MINLTSNKMAFKRMPAERLRRPLFWVFGVALTGLMLVTKPHGFGHGLYKAAELIGFLLIFLAVLGRLWCALYISGRKNRELCRSGPYAYCRNPLYLFSFLGVLGICLAAQSPLALAVAAPLFLIYYWFMVWAEEQRLHQIFGAEYAAYCQEVARFWPQWNSFSVPPVLEVDVRTFTRNLREVFWFLAAIIIVEALEAAKLASFFPWVESSW